MNNGGGIFRDLATYPAGSGPDGLAAADVNHDGKLDLIAPDLSSNSVSVLLGNGDGTFGKYYDFPSSSANAQPGASSIAVGDFNGDGRLDIAVVNYNDSTVAILLGQKP